MVDLGSIPRGDEMRNDNDDDGSDCCCLIYVVCVDGFVV